jgi:hypothetical protein
VSKNLTRAVNLLQWDALLRSQATPLSLSKPASSSVAATAPIQKQLSSSNAATSSGGGVNNVPPEVTQASEGASTGGEGGAKASSLGNKSAPGAGGGAGLARLEIKVPVGGAGLVVGKNGKTIKSIKARSGCKVDLAAEVSFTLLAGFHSPQCLTCDFSFPFSDLSPPHPPLTPGLFFGGFCSLLQTTRRGRWSRSKVPLTRSSWQGLCCSMFCPSGCGRRMGKPDPRRTLPRSPASNALPPLNPKP